MAFLKTAKLPLVSLAAGQFDTASNLITFKRTASRKEASIYEGTNKFDVKSALDMVAEDYDISNNPNDYIFEAARAVTAEVPNENGDAFPRSELLRFDHRLGKAVYQTFILKPHHINHRADNPKTSRGVVLDASYNDRTPPIEECPGCASKTASIEARDSSGVNCRKCGHVVKDEFVELLIAVDLKKDPTFAGGVKNGSLDSLSMGCEAGYTDCSICDNRARTTTQFCQHIKSGNKKKMFKTANGRKMSYEKCGEVIFTEISRVDQPADPTARSREIFQVVPQVESEMLMLATRLAKLEDKLVKGAQLQGQDAVFDIKPEEVEPLKATHPHLYEKLMQMLPELSNGDQEVAEPMSIDDYEKKHQEDIGKQMSSAEMGVKPEQGSGLTPTAASKIASSINADLSALIAGTAVLEEMKVGTPTLKFANSYKDLEVEVTSKGNVRVFTPKGTLFIARPTTKPADAVAADKIANEVLTHIAQHGLVETATKYTSVMGPHIAQVLEKHVEDFAGGREEGDKKSPTEGGLGGGQLEARETPEKTLVKEEHTDRKDEKRDSKSLSKDDVLEEEAHDHKENKPHPKDVLHPGRGQEKELNDMDHARSKAPKTTQEDIQLDHKDKGPSDKIKTAEAKQAELPDFIKKKQEEKAGKADSDKKDDKKEEKHDKDAQMAGLGPAAPAPAAPAPAPAPTGAGPAMAAPMSLEACGMPECMGKEPHGAHEPGTCHECKMPHEACGCGKMGMTASAKKYVSRMERLYKKRLDAAKEESATKIASLEKDAIAKVEARLIRALRLAAKRQALNLEFSPLKDKMFEVLAGEMDIDSDSFYPGMDAEVASRLIEATADVAFDAHVDSLVKRATEFLSMNEDALKAIESDIKNLRTAPVTVQASKQTVRVDGEGTRRAAMSGNLVVAPSATSEVVSNGNKRDNIRSALDTTKVRRHGQNLLNR